MLEAVLVDRGKKENLHTARGPFDFPTLVVHTHAQATGVFQVASAAAAGTTDIVTTEIGESIVLVDLLVSASRQAASTFVLEFNDGADTEIIFSPDVVNAPVNLAIAFQGLWQGWSGAGLRMVTTGNFDHRVSVGYYRVRSTLTYDEWNGLR